MKKEEYSKIVLEKNQQIDRLKIELSNLEKEYLEENKPCSIGQKVKVTDAYGDQYGFVKNFYVHKNGEIYPRLVKSKKDGTPSSHRLYPDMDVNIEFIPND